MSEEQKKQGASIFGEVLQKCGDFATTRRILTLALIEAQRCDAEWQKSQNATKAAVEAVKAAAGKLEID